MKQGYNARLDESIGARNGKKSQSMKDRRDESKAMSKKMYGHAYGADKGMSYRHDHGDFTRSKLCRLGKVKKAVWVWVEIYLNLLPRLYDPR